MTSFMDRTDQRNLERGFLLQVAGVAMAVSMSDQDHVTIAKKEGVIAAHLAVITEDVILIPRKKHIRIMSIKWFCMKNLRMFSVTNYRSFLLRLNNRCYGLRLHLLDSCLNCFHRKADSPPILTILSKYLCERKSYSSMVITGMHVSSRPDRINQ